MYQVSEEHAESSLDWLYALAAKYPLLSAEEEKRIDREKWAAAQAVQDVMVDTPAGVEYLSLWASNLLNNPPTLNMFSDREQYQLLRRDHSRYLKPAPARQHLVLLGARKADSTARKHALAGLELDATLAVGLAECLIGKTNGNDLSAALQNWQSHWPVEPSVMEGACHPEIASHIDSYYRSRNGLVKHNLRLVFSIAAKHKGQLPYRDLIQEGTLGLIRAAEKYRQDTGYRFSTYAFNWIAQAVRRGNETLGGAVRFPSHARALVSSIHRERINYHNRYGNDPDRETLARLLDMEPDKLDRFEQLGDLALSLDSNASGDPTAPTMLESMSGGPFNGPESSANRAWLMKVLKQRVALLSPDEKRVIVRRWGLDGSVPGSRKDVATIMNISTEWVRQLESMGLEKLADDHVLQKVFRDQYLNRT